jgi:ribosomal protein L15
MGQGRCRGQGGARFGRGHQHGGRGHGGHGGHGGRGRNNGPKSRPDSTFIKLTDGQEIEYHPSFHFPPHVFNKMRDEDRDQMQKERKEYNLQKDQSRQIQQLQQQLSVATSVQGPLTDQKSVGQASHISQITQGTRHPGSTMFGGHNEQASYRHPSPPPSRGGRG